MRVRIKTLIVDDSSLVRKVVRDMLERNIQDINFLDDAKDGREALERIMRLRPDLVILDVEMPRMDGITLLRELRRRRIRPVILMLSHLTQQGAGVTFEALELGALDFVPKPAAGSGITLADIESLLVTRVNGLTETVRDITQFDRHPIHESKLHRKHSRRNYELLFIGASTGGPQALQNIFLDLPYDFPYPIMVVQHMPPVFTRAFAERLNRIAAVQVMEAEDGMILKPAHAYLAPGNRHMLVERSGTERVIRITDDPPRHAHRPSLDVTIESIHAIYGGNVAAIIMTGMGWDGATGMKMLYDSGALTMAQDEDSSVVFGMNRRAIEAGGIVRVVSLKKMVEVLLKYIHT